MPGTNGTVEFYAAGLQKYLQGNLPVTSAGCLKALLVTAAYTVDQENHTDLTDITNQAWGTGGADDWPQGGVALANVTLTIVPADDVVSLTFDTITKTDAYLRLAGSGAAVEAKRAIVYHALPVADADKTLLCAITLADGLKPVGGALVLASPDGLFTSAY